MTHTYIHSTSFSTSISKALVENSVAIGILIRQKNRLGHEAHGKSEKTRKKYVRQ